MAAVHVHRRTGGPAGGAPSVLVRGGLALLLEKVCVCGKGNGNVESVESRARAKWRKAVRSTSRGRASSAGVSERERSEGEEGDVFGALGLRSKR